MAEGSFWTRKFSCGSCQGLNPQSSNHESSALSLSWIPVLKLWCILIGKAFLKWEFYYVFETVKSQTSLFHLKEHMGATHE